MNPFKARTGMTYCEYQAHSAKTQARLHFVLSIASAPGLPGRSDCHVRSSCSSRELPPSTSRVPPSPRGTPPFSLRGNMCGPPCTRARCTRAPTSA